MCTKCVWMDVTVCVHVCQPAMLLLHTGMDFVQFLCTYSICVFDCKTGLDTGRLFFALCDSRIRNWGFGWAESNNLKAWFYTNSSLKWKLYIQLKAWHWRIIQCKFDIIRAFSVAKWKGCSCSLFLHWLWKHTYFNGINGWKSAFKCVQNWNLAQSPN